MDIDIQKQESYNLAKEFLEDTANSFMPGFFNVAKSCISQIDDVGYIDEQHILYVDSFITFCEGVGSNIDYIDLMLKKTLGVCYAIKAYYHFSNGSNYEIHKGNT